MQVAEEEDLLLDPILGQTVRQARLARGWSQGELGRLIGISVSHLSNLERTGNFKPYHKKLIEQALNISLGENVKSKPIRGALQPAIRDLVVLAGAFAMYALRSKFENQKIRAHADRISGALGRLFDMLPAATVDEIVSSIQSSDATDRASAPSSSASLLPIQVPDISDAQTPPENPLSKDQPPLPSP